MQLIRDTVAYMDIYAIERFVFEAKIMALQKAIDFYNRKIQEYGQNNSKSNQRMLAFCKEQRLILESQMATLQNDLKR